MEIDIDIEVISDEDKNTQVGAVNSISNDLKNIKQQSSSDTDKLKVLYVNGDTMILDRVESVGDVTGVCLDGSVFGTINHLDKTGEQTCGMFKYIVKYYRIWSCI